LFYTFNGTINLSNPGNYNLKSYTSLLGDGLATNDTARKTVVNIPILATFPYNQGFETGNGGWTVGGINSSWALGTPNNTIINSAASELRHGFTNLTGIYKCDEESFCISPCFRFYIFSITSFIHGYLVEY